MTSSTSARVSIEDGVVFATGGGRELCCDVFTPPAGTANGAGLLLLHGGGWYQGDRSQLRGYGVLLGRVGYACVASEYRLSGEAKWPAQLEDARAAVRWMRAHASELGIDAARIAVSGNSAGGHLSLMLAAGVLEGEAASAAAGSEVATSIAFYPPVNLGLPADREVPAGDGPEQAQNLPDAVRALFGEDQSRARVRAASPISYARADFPPTMLITGNRDEIVPAGESLRMYRALSAVGARAELHVYEGAPHAFDASPAFGRQCAGLMALFLDRHVGEGERS